MCQDGLPNCLAGPELMQDVHAAGGDAEAFYFHASADLAGFTMESALEAAYAGDGDGQEMTFQRTQAVGKNMTPNGRYTFTDPYRTYTCTADATGLVQPAKGCRFETTPIPGNFTAALAGPIGPFLTWDTFGSLTGAPPAGFIGDNTTPHAVVGSPTGFNKMRVSGPGIAGTCTNSDGSSVNNCQETDKLVLQGKTVNTGNPAASVSSGTLDFGDVPAGAPAIPPVTKTLTYANTGSVPVTIGSLAVGGANAAAFTQTNTCGTLPATIAVGARCTIDVTFTPEPGKASAATLTITDDTPTATRNIALKGSNLPNMVVSDPVPPAGLAFPATGVATSSAEDNVVIANSGNGPLTVASATITGASAAHFKLGPNNTCTGAGVTVAPDSGCEIGVQFAPTTTGSKTANLRVTDANGKIVNIPLSGTGLAAPVDTTAPSAPTLSGTRTGTTVNLTWTAASDNVGVTGYQLFRDGAQVGPTLVPTTRTFADADVAPGAHSYTVRAVDGAGNVSVASNTVSITVPAPDTQAPTVSTLSGSRTGTTANLSWNAASDNVGVTGYQVFRDGVQVGANLAATARSSADANLAPGTYSYTVKALDAAGNISVASNTVTITVPAPDTTAPTASTLSGSLTGSTANLSWTAATDNVGVTGYQVSRNGTQVGTTTAGTRTFSQANLAAGTYAYTVRAIDAAGNVSAGSNSVSLTVPTAPVADTQAPSASTLSGSLTGSTANLSWTAATDNVGVTGYQVSRNGTQVGTTTAATRTFSQANLAAGTYAYTVRAVDAAGNLSPVSNTVSLTVPTAQPANPAPTVTARTPATSATAVAVANDITATFSEAVTGVSGTTVTLRNATTNAAITAAVSYNTTTRVATLNPSANLAADTRYTVTLTGGATAIRDTAGAPLATTSWSFLTGAAPTVTARTPAIGPLTGISRTANVTATFSEAVTGVSGTTFTLRNATTNAAITAVVSYNATTRVATLNPSATLAANTRYTVTLTGGTTAIRDIAGNPLGGTRTWSFTTGAA
jgi:hypothetical protein